MAAGDCVRSQPEMARLRSPSCSASRSSSSPSIYWVEPAGSLPSFFPGHEAGSSHHHVKHGIAAFLVGLACLAFAWFNTGPKKRAAESPDAG